MKVVFAAPFFLLLHTTDAVADDDAAVTFARATALVEKYDCKAAVPLLQEVFSKTQSPNAQLYIARCQRELGFAKAAYDTYGALIDLAKTAKYAETRTAAIEERALLRSSLATLLLTAPNVSGLQVTIANVAISSDQMAEVVVDPGTVHVHAEAPGHQAFDETVTVSAGARRKVVLALPLSPEPEPRVREQTQPTSLRVPAYISLGTAGASYIVAGVAYAAASSSYSSLRDECTAGCTQARIDEKSSSGRTLDTVTNVALVVGTVTLLTGGTLLLVDWLRGKESKNAASVFRGFAF